MKGGGYRMVAVSVAAWKVQRGLAGEAYREEQQVKQSGFPDRPYL